MFSVKGILFIIFFIINFKNNYCQFINIDKKLEDIINPLINDTNIKQRYVGIVVGIIKNNHDKFYSFGSVNINKNEKPKENTIFEIGSITKTFTTTLLADAHIRNIIDINDYLKKCDLNITNGFCFEDIPISLTNLSTHTSGYPRIPNNLPLTSLTPYDNYYREDLDIFLSTYKLSHKSGKFFEYSNLGLGILGTYLSDKQNESYENLIKKRISEPYKLYDTKIVLNNEQKIRYANGYLSGIETPHWNMEKSALSAAGGLHSTINNMLKYLRLQIFDENKIFKLTHIERYIINSNLSIGLGWFIDKINNIIWHDGGTYGFTSFIGFDKTNKIGVIIMANTFIENDTRINEIGIKIINILKNI